jgi:hypothetical protein
MPRIAGDVGTGLKAPLFQRHDFRALVVVQEVRCVNSGIEMRLHGLSSRLNQDTKDITKATYEKANQYDSNADTPANFARAAITDKRESAQRQKASDEQRNHFDSEAKAIDGSSVTVTIQVSGHHMCSTV